MSDSLDQAEKHLIRLFQEFCLPSFCSFAPDEASFSIFAREFADRFAAPVRKESRGQSLGEKLSAFEESWWRFVNEHLSRQFLRACLFAGTDNAQTAQKELLKRSSFLFAAERAVLQVLAQEDRESFYSLVCRHPLLLLPYDDFLSGSREEPVFPGQYLEVIESCLLQLFRSKSAKESCTEKFTSLLVALKSPFLDVLSVLEYAERASDAEARLVYDILFQDVVSCFKLRPEQYGGKAACSTQTFAPPITDDCMLALMVVRTCGLSEAFFKKLPFLLIERLGADAPDVFKEQEIGELKEFLVSTGVITFEFPELQLEAVLRKEISRLLLVSHAAKEPHKKRQILDDYVEKLLSLRRIFEISFYEVRSDYERSKQMLADISEAPNERQEQLLHAGRLLELSRKRYEQLAADTAALAGELKREDVLARVFSFLRHDAPQWLDSPEGAVTMYAVQDAVSRLFEELDAVIKEIAEPGSSRESRLALVRNFKQGLTSVLSWKRSDLADPLGNEALIDPISAARFDLPDPRGRRVQELIGQVDFSAREALARTDRARKRLLQVAEIVRGLKAGLPEENLKHLFPAHLVEAVALRLSLKNDPAGQAPAESRKKSRLLQALVEQKHYVDCFVETHCGNLALLHQAVIDRLRKRAPDASSALRAAFSILAFDACWEWYVGGSVNPYINQARQVAAVKDIAERRAAFGPWLQRAIFVGLGDYQPELKRLLILRRPCLFAAGLADFNVEESIERDQYISLIVEAFIFFAADSSGDDLVRLWETFFSLIRNPYRDAFQRQLYDLNGFVGQLFLFDQEQQIMFSAEARRAMLANWVQDNELKFWGQQELGLFPELFISRLREIDEELHNKLVDAASDREVRFLRELTGGSDAAEDDEGVIMRALSPLESRLKQVEIFRDLFRAKYSRSRD